MNIKRDLEFLYEIGTLRFLQRKWVQFLNPQFQNISEHTFRVIWIALIIAKHEKVPNIEKLITMAIIHDLGESRTGDADYVARQYSQREEEMAVEDMLKGTVLSDWFEIWREYEKRACIEAKIVKDADNLDVDLELKEQEAQGHTLRAVWNDMRKHVTYKKLYTKTAKQLWKEIQTSSPHDWHIHARNRYTAGDWRK